MTPLRWTLAHGVRAAYSTAADGDMHDAQARGRWTRTIIGDRPCVVTKQIHGVRIVAVDRPEPPLSGTDGLATTNNALALGVFGADCPGLVVAAPDAFGVAHCGWRGTAARMPGKLIEALKECSAASPETWSALIGPGICGPEYEVDEPVLSARAWPTSSVTPTRERHAKLDLAVAIADDLASAGVKRVTLSHCCTRRDDRLWSYRERGAGQVQLLIAWRE